MADVSTPCMDHAAMLPYWQKVDAILGGVETMRKQKAFLPKFPNESDKDYTFRLNNARFTNVFRDIAENLAAKPFAKELEIQDADKFPDIMPLCENIDGNGNHIHVFSADVFFRGLSHGLHWIFVDHPPAQGVKTVADKAKVNARPYWVSLPATAVIAAETMIMGGVSAWKHVRFRADEVVRNGYEEKTIEKIREYNRDEFGVTYLVWEKVKSGNATKWEVVEEGKIDLPEIPLVLFRTGRMNKGTWVVTPLLQDAADLQVEVFQAENGLKHAKDNTAFPMLAGNGVMPPTDANGKPMVVPVGPNTVLYAPPNADNQHGEWRFIEPNSQSLQFLSDDIDKAIAQLRELGRQPLTAQTGNLTTVMAAASAGKGNSAIAAAALLLKDALENALRLTAAWLNIKDGPEVEIHTDFDIGLPDNNGLADLISARKNGDLSRETLWDEMKRRNILSAEFDGGKEALLIASELPELDTMQNQMDSLVQPAA